jgi:hypothetical protein
MGRKEDNRYDQEFYAHHLDGSIKSAQVVLTILYNYFSPVSVIDFGCSKGGWLSVAESLGSRDLAGLDGAWVSTEDIISKNIRFKTVDFNNKITIDKKYDLCISVEVAEHVKPNAADNFICSLCNSSDVIIFSAAIERQGGTGHINEQWQSYWIEKFGACNFQCFDLFRPRIWYNDEVDWWYRQNIFLFVKRSCALVLPTADTAVHDMVHPALYNKKMDYIDSLKNKISHPSLRECMDFIKRYLKDIMKFKK